MHRRRFLLGSATAGAVLLAGCAEDGVDDEATAAEPNGNGEETPRERIEIREHELATEGVLPTVQGLLVNDTGETIPFVELSVTFYDVDGDQIADSTTNTTNLPDSEEWQFEIATTVDAKAIDDYEIQVSDLAL